MLPSARSLSNFRHVASRDCFGDGGIVPVRRIGAAADYRIAWVGEAMAADLSED
jgi:hypothetical protein